MPKLVTNATPWNCTADHRSLPALLFALLMIGCGSSSDSEPDAVLGADALAMADAVVIPDAAPQPNCVGLSPTCGSGGNQSCCASTVVPGGTYYRSYDLATDAYNDMSYPATVSDFRLDTYEITVGRFRKFVEAGKGTQTQPPVGGSGAHPAIAGSGWEAGWNANLAASTAALVAAIKCDPTYQTWTDAPGTNEHRPMNCITWYEAMAFCIWDSAYLPTEAEWNYAATGGAEQRAYPWSSPASSTTIDATHAVFSDAGLENVGSKSPQGDARWGQSDLAGNVWEWTLDWYASPYSNPCDDCADLTATSRRVARGGGFLNPTVSGRAALRNVGIPADRYYTYGARCARMP